MVYDMDHILVRIGSEIADLQGTLNVHIGDILSGHHSIRVIWMINLILNASSNGEMMAIICIIFCCGKLLSQLLLKRTLLYFSSSIIEANYEFSMIV